MNQPAAISEIRLRAGDDKGLSFEKDEVIASAKPSKKGVVKLTCKDGAPAGHFLPELPAGEHPHR